MSTPYTVDNVDVRTLKKKNGRSSRFAFLLNINVGQSIYIPEENPDLNSIIRFGQQTRRHGKKFSYVSVLEKNCRIGIRIGRVA